MSSRGREKDPESALIERAVGPWVVARFWDLSERKRECTVCAASAMLQAGRPANEVGPGAVVATLGATAADALLAHCGFARQTIAPCCSR